MIEQSTMSRRKNCPLLLAMTIVTVGVLLGCASGDRDIEDVTPVATGTDTGCSELEGRTTPIDTYARENETMRENAAPTPFPCPTDDKWRTDQEPEEPPFFWKVVLVMVGSAYYLGLFILPILAIAMM